MIVWFIFVLGFFCGRCRRFPKRNPKMILMWVPLNRNEITTTSSEFEIRYDYEDDDRIDERRMLVGAVRGGKYAKSLDEFFPPWKVSLFFSQSRRIIVFLPKHQCLIRYFVSIHCYSPSQIIAPFIRALFSIFFATPQNMQKLFFVKYIWRKVIRALEVCVLLAIQLCVLLVKWKKCELFDIERARKNLR